LLTPVFYVLLRKLATRGKPMPTPHVDNIVPQND
jgi:hypothetical protein